MVNAANPAPTPINLDASLTSKCVLNEISQALSGLRFGSVEVVVHEGKVTQIERKEKFRIQK